MNSRNIIYLVCGKERGTVHFNTNDLQSKRKRWCVRLALTFFFPSSSSSSSFVKAAAGFVVFARSQGTTWLSLDRLSCILHRARGIEVFSGMLWVTEANLFCFIHNA